MTDPDRTQDLPAAKLEPVTVTGIREFLERQLRMAEAGDRMTVGDRIEARAYRRVLQYVRTGE